ncbi:MAG: Gfo/Idh/MocA family oxidoreductase [Bacteroidales bacterium]|nr:Gfo/Idh/MocA family oxidoreductase [Bacteroidales bacterium]
MDRRKFLKTTGVAGTAAIIVPTIVPSFVMGKNAPSNRVNIAQIGCGRMGRGDLNGVMRHEKVRFMAVCDLDSKRMMDGKKLIMDNYAKMGMPNAVDVKMYGDYRELLMNKDIDGVVISTPDHWHSQPAIEAAIAGKNIYLQKPTSLTIKEGRQLSDAVHRSGVTFQIGSQQRSAEQFRYACELVRNGRIGDIHTIKVGLPGDPGGEEELEMPIPKNLNYNMWLGSTPNAYYTEKRVHPQHDYSRPGWLRCDQFGAGMITGWGAHHLDIAHWGMGTEFSGPIEVEAEADFPKSGLWNVHGDFMMKAKYANGTNMLVSGEFPNGVRFEGSEGWIFVTRGSYKVTDSDPVTFDKNRKSLDASDPKILTSKIGKDEINLYHSSNHYFNWVDSMIALKQPIAPVEVAHRSCSACLLGGIAMKLPGKLHWDPVKERFLNNDAANAMLSRQQRFPYGTDYV